MRKKRCRFCREEFAPAPRHWGQQTTCKKKVCQGKRKRSAQKAWVKDNPGHFRGRYASLKGSWDYRGYLKKYRREHPKYVATDNRERRERRRREARGADIQDMVARRRERVAGIRARRGADIQDTVKQRIDGVLELLDEGSADIQDLMALGAQVALR